MLVLQHVSMAYKDPTTHKQLQALDDVSFVLPEGQFTCVVGPSGGGKSTLINLVAGFLRPTSGEIMLNGRKVVSPGPDRGVVFQEYALFPWLTVLQNITFGLERICHSAREARDKARSMLSMVGLEQFASSYPHQLSGGMKQRVALARAWAMQPAILLMDEPFGALDAQTRVTMQNELLCLWSRQSITVLFVTHHVEEAVYLADRVLVFSRSPGHIVADIPIPAPRPRSLKSPVLAAVTDQVHGILAETAQLLVKPDDAIVAQNGQVEPAWVAP